jgi:hypothetical protein
MVLKVRDELTDFSRINLCTMFIASQIATVLGTQYGTWNAPPDAAGATTAVAAAAAVPAIPNGEKIHLCPICFLINILYDDFVAQAPSLSTRSTSRCSAPTPRLHQCRHQQAQGRRPLRRALA